MDATALLRLRTPFIRRYYSIGVGPFREIQRKIRDGESPYDEPPPFFDPEYGEPAFLEEWLEADEAAQVVGWSAVSLLSDSLKLYFRALEQQLHFHLTNGEKKVAKLKGFLSAYRGALGKIFEADWNTCSVNFDIVEQIVLARNRTQHGEHLLILGARHDHKTLAKYRNPIFASESELKMWIDGGADPDAWHTPRLEITEERLDVAVTEVEKLADWVEEQIQDL